MNEVEPIRNPELAAAIERLAEDPTDAAKDEVLALLPLAPLLLLHMGEKQEVAEFAVSEARGSREAILQLLALRFGDVPGPLKSRWLASRSSIGSNGYSPGPRRLRPWQRSSRSWPDGGADPRGTVCRLAKFDGHSNRRGRDGSACLLNRMSP